MRFKYFRDTESKTFRNWWLNHFIRVECQYKNYDYNNY